MLKKAWEIFRPIFLKLLHGFASSSIVFILLELYSAILFTLGCLAFGAVCGFIYALYEAYKKLK